MKTHLFVDLEDTLITSWYEPALCLKMDVVQDILNRLFGANRDVVPATVWSHAIGDKRDAEIFERSFRRWLENVYKLNFIRVVTMDEMCECTKNWTGFASVPPYELIQTYRKDISLEHWARTHITKDAHVILLDDTVENKEVLFKDDNLRLTYIKV